MKTKILSALFLLACVLHCPAPIPYILNSVTTPNTNTTLNVISSPFIPSTNYTAINWGDPNANGVYVYAGTNMNALYTAAFAPMIFNFWTNSTPSSENWQLVIDPLNGCLQNGNQVIQFATSNALAFTRINFRGNTNYAVGSSVGIGTLTYFTTWGQALNPSPAGILYPGSNVYSSVTVGPSEIVSNVNIVGNLSVGGALVEQNAFSSPVNPMLNFNFTDPAGNVMTLLKFSDETRVDGVQSLEKAMRIDLYGNNYLNTNFFIEGPTINPPSCGRFCFNAQTNGANSGTDSRVAIFESWATDTSMLRGGFYQIQVYPSPNANVNSIYGYTNGAITVGPKLTGDPQYPLFGLPPGMLEVWGDMGSKGLGMLTNGLATMNGNVNSGTVIALNGAYTNNFGAVNSTNMDVWIINSNAASTITYWPVAGVKQWSVAWVGTNMYMRIHPGGGFSVTQPVIMTYSAD